MIHLKSKYEKEIALNCLKAVMNEHIIPDWEFLTLFGLYKEEVEDIVENWESIDLSASDVQLAINNAFANLLGYPHGQEDIFEELLGVSPEELRDLFDKIRS